MTQYLNSIYRVIIYILKAFNKLHFFVFSLFRLFVISSSRHFVFSHGVISSFCLFVFSPGVISPRKDKITPGEKTTRRNISRRKRQKDATRKDNKIRVSNGVFSHGVFYIFSRWNSSFRVTGFVFSLGDISSFRMAFFFVFSHGVFFVFSRGVFSPRKDEMAQCSHQTLLLTFNSITVPKSLKIFYRIVPVDIYSALF